MTPLEMVASHLQELEAMAEAELRRGVDRDLSRVLGKITSLRTAVANYQTGSLAWYDPERITDESLADHWHGPYASGVSIRECSACRMMSPPQGMPYMREISVESEEKLGGDAAH